MNGTSMIAIVGLLALQGCAAGSIAGAAMQIAGIQKPPELPDAQKPARTVPIRLHASSNLNAGDGTQPLALAVRVYKLRQPTAFQQLNFNTFLSVHNEREVLGNDLLEVKEVMLIPGQRYEVQEKVTREAYYVGMVALFRAPAEQRWRLAFSAAEAEKSGVTVGLHACAMSVGSGAKPLAEPLETSRMLSAVRCQ